MNERKSARALLLDNQDRLLLFKVSDPSVSELNAPALGDFWCTIGGRIEDGEDVISAVTREIAEETGIKGDRLEIHGPIWYGEQTLNWKGVPTLLHETFVLVRTSGGAISAASQTAEERAVIRDMKWWTVGELETTTELILPPVLRPLLAPLIRGNVPTEVVEIDLSMNPKVP